MSATKRNSPLAWLMGGLLAATFSVPQVLAQHAPLPADVPGDETVSDPSEYVPSPEYLIPEGTPLFNDATRAVNRWLDAVAKRDVPTLLGFVSARDRERVERNFDDPQSVLYKYFLSDASTNYKKASAQNRGTVLFQQYHEYGKGYGITACFFDRIQLNPQTAEERQSVYDDQMRNTLCQFFYHTDGHWNFSYTDVEEIYTAPGVRNH